MSTNDQREALRECPFCGGKAMRKDDPGVIGEMFGLVVDHVPGCFLTLRGIEADEVFDAAWNKRSLPAPAPAAGEAVAGLAKDLGQLRQIFESWLARDANEQPVNPVTGVRPFSTGDLRHLIDTITAAQEALRVGPQAPATGGEEAAKIGEILVMEADIDDDDPRLPRIVSAILAALNPADAEKGRS